jgi:leucyl-tRNA synthetase
MDKIQQFAGILIDISTRIHWHCFRCTALVRRSFYCSCALILAAISRGMLVSTADASPVKVGRSEKMSKSKKNVVDPADIIESYGADTARWFMLSDSPPDRDLEWTEAGISGAWRFMNRLWRLVYRYPDDTNKPGTDDACPETDLELRQSIHKTIDGITKDLESFRFNRAVARIYELVNQITDFKYEDSQSSQSVLSEAIETLIVLLGPMVPHLAEEMWSKIGKTGLLANQSWPTVDSAMLIDEMVTLAVQIKGKLKGTISVRRDADQSEVEKIALEQPSIAAALEGKSIARIIYVPNRILNVVHA